MAIDLAQFHQVFFEESIEGLDIMESSLMALDITDIDDETINAIFRSAHSIKGGSATFGFSSIAEFTHVLETLLDQVRSGDRGLSADDINLLLKSVDCMREMLSLLQAGEDGITEDSKELKLRFTALLDADPVAAASTEPQMKQTSSEASASAATPESKSSEASIESEPVLRKWAITFEPYTHIFLSGNDPLRNIQSLNTLGEIEVTCSLDVLPPLSAFNPESAYLKWHILLQSRSEKSDIEEIFEWIEDDCNLRIELVDGSQKETEKNRDWHIHFVPSKDILRSGNEPARLIRALAALGKIDVNASLSRMPDLMSMDSENCYLSWEIFLRDSRATLEDINEVFEWVADDSDIVVEAIESSIDVVKQQISKSEPQAADKQSGKMQPPSASSEQSSSAPSTAKVDHQSGVSTPTNSQSAVSASPEPSATAKPENKSEAKPDIKSPTQPAHKPASQIDKPVAASAPKPASAAPAPAQAPAASEKKAAVNDQIAQKIARAKKAQQAAKKTASETASIRVGIDKVDSLINMVGELVITQSMLGQLGTEHELERVPKLMEGLSQLEQNTRELQESVMKIRMLPISFAFSRFPRMVRDLGQSLGKAVVLEMNGENTELDKTVMEKIGDPLVHLVRNAVDHGLETPDVRSAAGKDPTGRIVLNAFHQSGNVVIEIIDDGRGLDRTAIVNKAIQSGIITQHEADALSEEQVYELIFQPGFSTAATVSDVSGRGVGMDVVKRNIQALNGIVEISSEKNKGSKITIRLPLTLAILDGQLVRVGNNTYIFSLVSIIESMQCKGELINKVGGGCSVFKLRDDYVPIIELFKAFSIKPDSTNLDESLLVVVEADGEKVGIVVDELLGQQQVVIKSLEQNYQRVDGISGATILGDGTVALILDIPGIIKLSSDQMGSGTEKLGDVFNRYNVMNKREGNESRSAFH